MIDLHTHTNHSDASISVPDLLKEAEAKKLLVLSITDHNTVTAYDELKDNEIRSLYQGKIIKGIELTAIYQGEIVEVLGYQYNIDKIKPLLKKHYDSFEQEKINEFELIKDRFLSIGVKMNLNNIVFDPKIKSSRTAFLEEISKYPENDKFFFDQKPSKNLENFTRGEVFNPQSLLYVDFRSLYPSLEEAINIIHEALGIAFLAHLFVYTKATQNNLSKLINDYKLDGLECYHLRHNREQTEFLINYCDQNNLLKSGGSDYHKNNVSSDLGVGEGNLNIPESLIINWKDRG